MPKWLDNAVFYEIYPQSFLDTNADGIGDFQGIINQLDYIRGLGCNALWINPCFLSPFGDAGYDVADYYQRRAPVRHERGFEAPVCRRHTSGECMCCWTWCRGIPPLSMSGSGNP